MKILHVGNGNLKHHGSRYYDCGRKINNGLVRNGHNVYFFSDRDTARAATMFGVSKLGGKSANSIFIETCINFEPDIILFGHADIITPAAIEKVRSLLPQARFAQYNVDPIFRPHNIAMLNAKAHLMDATFCTTAGEALAQFACAHNVVSYTPNPTDASIDYPQCFAHDDQEFDMFWAMRGLKGSYAGDPRIEIPLFLEQDPAIKIDYYGFNGKPELFNAKYYKAIANSRMGLNISVTCTYHPNENIPSEQYYLYSSDRIAQYIGSGLLTFTTRDNCLEEIFEEDKELIFFANKEELREKVRYYIKHDQERKKIAKAGWEKYHRCFNEIVITKYMLEVTQRQPLSQTYEWPTTLYKKR